MLGLTPLIFILRRAKREQQQHQLHSHSAQGEGLDKDDSLLTPFNQTEFAEASVEGSAVAAGAQQITYDDLRHIPSFFVEISPAWSMVLSFISDHYGAPDL